MSITGLAFAIPMAVQPMKAIAAVAIAEGLTVGQILAAGATVSLFILILGLTGLIDWLNRVVPRSVVRGLQLALGLTLMMKGLQLVSNTGHWWAIDGYLTAAVAAVVVVAFSASRVVPVALLLFVVGILLTAFVHPDVVRTIGLDITLPGWSPPGWGDFLTAFPKAALPQIPLTTLNSVIAVCALSADLFPDRPATPKRVSISVGLMNLVGCWFGACRCATAPAAWQVSTVSGADQRFNSVFGLGKNSRRGAFRRHADGILPGFSPQHFGRNGRRERAGTGAGNARSNWSHRCFRHADHGGRLLGP